MIQRFIILHLNIHEWSFPNDQQNDSSAEDTSDDELQIPILFYYESNNDDGKGHSVVHPTATTTTTDRTMRTPSIVVRRRIQFAGLCQALYHLPDTISRGNHHRTKMVQYDSNTALVFVPLHDETTTWGRHARTTTTTTKLVDIVAVAQIVTGTSPSSHYHHLYNTTTTQSLPSSPNAIYQAIQRSYLQFCLLRNGTIHERLLQRHQKNNNDEYYPGMDQLYFYYRQHQRRRTSPKSSHDTIHQVPMIESYTKLRHDLQYHFDDLWTVTPNHHHTGARIDAYYIPSIPNNTTPPAVQWNEQGSQPQQQHVLPQAIHRHMMPTMVKPSSSDTPHVLGMSIFMANQLTTFDPHPKGDRWQVIDTASLQHAIRTAPNDTDRILLLADECAIILFHYMKQIQSRITMQQRQHQQQTSDHVRPTSATSQPIRKSSSFAKLLRPFALSFMKDDCMVSSPIKLSTTPLSTTTTTASTGTTLQNITIDSQGIFLAPPPFSLLSVLDDDQSTSFVYQEAEMEEDNVSTVYVWAPSVALPITEVMANDTIEQGIDQSTSIRKTVPVRMCLYMRQHSQCLLYLSRPDHSIFDDSERNSSRVYQNLFHLISRQIDQAIEEVTDLLNVSDQQDHANQTVDELIQNCSSSTTTSWDIQYSTTLPFIHKPGMNVFVMDRLKHTISLHIDDDRTRPHDVARATNQRHSDERHTDVPLHSNDNDMRNLFIKHLPLDTVLALEDAIEEVHQFIQRNSTTPAYESCTLLRQQWVYSYYACNTELYILFHTSHFVTISDVQQEAQRIRNAYLPNR